MTKRNTPALLAAFALILFAGCGKKDAVDAPNPSPPQNTTTAPPANPDTKPPTTTASPTPIKDAVETTLKENKGNVFPPGTRLLSMDLKDGVASLDFSSEFSAVANAGDSGESEVQHTLMATLAKFPEVQKMRVTVNGKPFDSQATDWNTPFSVHANSATPAKDTAASTGGGN